MVQQRDGKLTSFLDGRNTVKPRSSIDFSSTNKSWACVDLQSIRSRETEFFGKCRG